MINKAASKYFGKYSYQRQRQTWVGTKRCHLKLPYFPLLPGLPLIPLGSFISSMTYPSSYLPWKRPSGFLRTFTASVCKHIRMPCSIQRAADTTAAAKCLFLHTSAQLGAQFSSQQDPCCCHLQICSHSNLSGLPHLLPA